MGRASNEVALNSVEEFFDIVSEASPEIKLDDKVLHETVKFF